MDRFDLNMIRQLSEMLSFSPSCTCILPEVLVTIVEEAKLDLAVIFIKNAKGETFVLSCSHQHRFQRYKSFFKSNQFSACFTTDRNQQSPKFNIITSDTKQVCHIYSMPLSLLYDMTLKCTLILIGKSNVTVSEDDLSSLRIILNQIGLAIDNELISANTNRLSKNSFMILDSLAEGILIVSNQNIFFWNQKLNSLIESRKLWTNHSIEQFFNHLLSISKDKINTQLAIDTLQNDSIKHYRFFIETSSNRFIQIKKYPLEKHQTTLKTWGIIVSDFTQYKESDKLKDDLISTVSHELRTPLTSIKGNASALLRTDIVWPIEDQILFLRDIYEESDYLNDLIGKLLDFSKINAGALRIDPTILTVHSFVRNLTGQLHKRYKERIKRIRINSYPEKERIEIDEQRIIQVFTNLIDNAFKHNSEDVQINIDFQKVNHEIQFTVRDNGKGIPKENINNIFEKFYQKDPCDVSAGFGLGLAICKGFIAIHNGDIWVESSAGCGSSFHFSLPIVRG